MTYDLNLLPNMLIHDLAGHNTEVHLSCQVTQGSEDSLDCLCHHLLGRWQFLAWLIFIDKTGTHICIDKKSTHTHIYIHMICMYTVEEMYKYHAYS